MTFVRQRHKTDCGIAALAMLCDVSYEVAEKAIPWQREGIVYGTTTTQLRVGGKNLGYCTKSTPKDRLKPLRGASWYEIPNNSLVKVPHPKGQGYGWHWVVWRKGRVYDPARGVFEPKKYDNIPTSYMRFIDVDDPCPECGTQLEAKWSGVDCPNYDYWFCY